MKEKSKVIMGVAIIEVIGAIVVAFFTGENYAVIQQNEYWNEQITNINENWASEIMNTNEFWASQITNIKNNNSNTNNININNQPIVEENVEENYNNIDFTVETKVRLADSEDKTWYKNIEANIGDILEFQIEYTNTSDTNQNGVVIKDVLPNGLWLLLDSVIIYNANYESGAIIENGYAIMDTGVNIGSYTPGSNAFSRFKAKIVDDGTLSSNTIVNYGQAEVSVKTIKNSVNIYVN